MNDADGLAFLERELLGLGVIPGKGAIGIGPGWVPVGQSSQLCKWTGAHLHILRASDLFLQVKCITFLTLKLVH